MTNGSRWVGQFGRFQGLRLTENLDVRLQLLNLGNIIPIQPLATIQDSVCLNMARARKSSQNCQVILFPFASLLHDRGGVLENLVGRSRACASSCCRPLSTCVT